jgi:hypothetical protein
MLAVSKTSVPFNFQLSVSRVYEDGDANILDDDDDEGMFQIISHEHAPDSPIPP